MSVLPADPMADVFLEHRPMYVKYTSHTYTGTNAWGFPQSRNVRFFAPGNFLTHFTILSFQIHSNFSFKCIVQTIDVFVIH